MKKNTKRLLLFAAAAGLSTATYLYFLPPVRKYKKAKYPFALLLGCPSHLDGSMSTSQIRRCDLAIRAWKEGEFDTLIISGGAVKNSYIESLEMKKYIHERVPGMPVFCEMKARNTWENFKYAKEIIQDRPVLVLCSSLHAARSNAIARQFFDQYAIQTYPDHKLKHILREIPSRLIYIHTELKKKRKGAPE